VTFKKSGDKRGTTSDHAKELGSIIEDFKRKTGADRVNIIGHSKGGLDASIVSKTKCLEKII
jgi:triacylglycerol lipase